MPLCFRVKGTRKGNANICLFVYGLHPTRGKFRNHFATKPLIYWTMGRINPL